MADDIFESERARKVFWALHKCGLTNFLIRVVMPFYGKANKYDPKDFRIFAVGQSHLDSAWNWRWIPDTAPYKLSHTVGYNIQRLAQFPQRNLRPGYQDGYKFSFPAAAHYEYIEQKWPRAFKKIQQLVKAGRWEIVGGSWIEMDANVPDGESFVRQRLYGQKYFIEKFGKKALIEWLPDSFGFSWSLPQILKKSGATGFFTTKLTWNVPSRTGTGTRFPFGWFWWQPPSGAEDRILAYNFKHGWRGLEYLRANKEICRLVKAGQQQVLDYNTDFDSNSPWGDDYIHEVLWMYGQGDGGHGPNSLEIMVADAAERIGKMQQVKAGTIFKLIQMKYQNRLPVWADELYLEFHRGVQTTLHRLKHQNRFAECSLQTLEKLLGFAKLVGMPNPKDHLDRVWKKVLFNQFHDILPGSSIQEVYEDSDRDFNELIAPTMAALIESGWSSLSKSYEKAQPEDNLLAFFPHHWDLVYRLEIGEKGEKKAIYQKKSPGIGFETLNISLKNKSIYTIESEKESIVIKTPHYSATINRTTSFIDSLMIKGDEYDFAASQLNALRLFQDYPKDNDAWNLDWYYREKPCPAPRISNIEICEFGCEHQIKFDLVIGDRSSGILTYYISGEVPYIRCEFACNWQEDHRLLRVEFDTPLDGGEYSTGLAYGSINRPTRPTLPLQKGRWEVPGQNFISLSTVNKEKGLSILVFDNYGFHCEGGQFGISLLKAPGYGHPSKRDAHWYDPSTEASRLKIKDLGQHQLIWCVYPHRGDWKAARTFPLAMAVNYPPLVSTVSTPVKLGDFPPIMLDVDNVLVGSIKAPYEEMQISDSGEFQYILRFYEFTGVPTIATFSWGLLQSVQNLVVEECDLLEQKLKSPTKLEIMKPGFRFQIKPFEIKSFRLKFTKKQ